ncbi:hypothetical protein AA13594_1093 [Gluconacetobacter azotocaptans DSM 13594]|nr:hypothetical protein AA13594_1093 [Gluconacetobacter azotocaptans DSM 13594]
MLVLAERARLLQKLVHQRGFAMVDVSDDGDIADIHNVCDLTSFAGHPTGAPAGPGALASRTGPTDDSVFPGLIEGTHADCTRNFMPPPPGGGAPGAQRPARNPLARPAIP